MGESKLFKLKETNHGTQMHTSGIDADDSVMVTFTEMGMALTRRVYEHRARHEQYDVCKKTQRSLCALRRCEVVTAAVGADGLTKEQAPQAEQVPAYLGIKAC